MLGCVPGTVGGREVSGNAPEQGADAGRDKADEEFPGSGEEPVPAAILANGTQLQGILDQQRQGQNALGAAASILVEGTGVWHGASGLTTLNGPSLSPGALFGVGSVTKIYTGVVILQLAEQGLLSVDDPVSYYLGGLPNQGALTIRHLLRHQSGLADYLADPNANITAPTTHSALLSYASSQGSQFAPGSRYEYSNTNYIALGLIAETVSGTSYHQLVRTNILSRIGLQQTSMEGDENIAGPVVRGMYWNNGQYQSFPLEHPSWAWAAGALVSTPEEQVLFIRALMNGQLLSPASLADMQQGVDAGGGSRYGLGLMTTQTSLGTAYFHGGLINDTFTTVIAIPQGNVYAAVYLNTYPGDTMTVAQQLMSAAVSAQ